IGELRPRARRPIRIAEGPLCRNPRPIVGADCGASFPSINAPQASDAGADPLLADILQQMPSAPAQRSADAPVKRSHAMPGKGTAQVAPEHAGPRQRLRCDQKLASPVVQSSRQAWRSGEGPLEAEQTNGGQEIGFQRRRQAVAPHSLLYEAPIDGWTEVAGKRDELMDLLQVQLAAIEIAQEVDLGVQ